MTVITVDAPVERIKKCEKCGDDKPLSSFHRSSRRLDGRSLWCIPCANERVRYYRDATRRAAPVEIVADERIQFSGRVRECKVCREFKPLELFPKGKGHREGRIWKCAACYAAVQMAAKERYRVDNREKRRARRVNTTVAQLQGMFFAQDGKCGICRSAMDYHGKDAHADHCHKTGKFRGILCRACNHAIGLFKDDPTRLRSAAAYLEESLKCGQS